MKILLTRKTDHYGKRDRREVHEGKKKKRKISQKIINENGTIRKIWKKREKKHIKERSQRRKTNKKGERHSGK